jgi:hypothetical protein
MRGSGKSAILKAIGLQSVALGHPTSGIDLEGGPNFGRLAHLFTNYATTIPEALELLNELNLERERNLLALNHPDAPDAAETVSHVLLLDELAMLTHKQRPHSSQVMPILDDCLARGRKPAFTVIAATQHPEVAVLPTLLQSQFTHTIGLRTEYRRQTNTILGEGALGDGWDLSTIPEDQPGRGLWKAGPRITPIRCAGAYGDGLRTGIRRLTARRQAAVDAVPKPTSTQRDTVTADPQPLTPKEASERDLTADEVKEAVREAAELAGLVGVRVKALADKLSVSEPRIARACRWWRDQERMRTDGTRWYWIEVR